MEKEFIPYEQALALKELGFESPYPIGGYQGGKVFYYENGELYYDSRPMYSSDAHSGQILAPLYQQAFRWFREKYNLFCEIQIDRTTEPKFCFDIFQYEHFGNYEKIEVKEWYLYRTQEEVELECLKKLIEILKQK
jgi:hypothetical protein